MNTATGHTRINLTIPKDIFSYLKHNSDNMSKYISEALRERIAREKRDKALKEILAAKPTFNDVKDGTTYVRELRETDKKRHASWPYMTYFIDTDVMIDFFKHKDPARELITNLSKQNTIALSTLTVTELRSGWTSEQAMVLIETQFRHRIISCP